MKMHTILLDEQRIQNLASLIAAAGKSPATSVDVMMQAAEMLAWLQQQVVARPTNVVAMPDKEQLNG